MANTPTAASTAVDEHADPTTVDAAQKAAAKPRARTSRSSAKPAAAAAKSDGGRVETYEQVRPDGKKVKITRNIDTGDHSAELVG